MIKSALFNPFTCAPNGAGKIHALEDGRLKMEARSKKKAGASNFVLPPVGMPLAQLPSIESFGTNKFKFP